MWVICNVALSFACGRYNRAPKENPDGKSPLGLVPLPGAGRTERRLEVNAETRKVNAVAKPAAAKKAAAKKVVAKKAPAKKAAAKKAPAKKAAAKKVAKKPAAKKAAKKPAAKKAAKKPAAKAPAAPAAPAAQTTLNPQAAWPFPTASKP